MPACGWNGKFEGVGNGGWAGTIGYPAMAQALARGYATTSTDTGHSTPGGSFALGHREKLIDYAYRSEHEMTVKAKAVINTFYGNAPQRSYFNGCSTGGRQALTEATRFPDDFDGIIAGAAANPKTHLDTWRIWIGLQTLNDPKWDWRTFDVDRDLAKADQVLHGLLTAIDPKSLGSFFGHGGKLLTYQGWSDQDISPLASVNFYKSVTSTIGDAGVSRSMRLFMVPGMGHCGGGEGPNTFDMIVPLEQWVEKGQAPTRIDASHSTDNKIDRTRPLCPYPQVSRYRGTGSVDEAANFTCQLP